MSDYTTAVSAYVICVCPVVTGGTIVHRETCPMVPPHTHEARLAEMNEREFRAKLAADVEALAASARPGTYVVATAAVLAIIRGAASPDKGEPRP